MDLGLAGRGILVVGASAGMGLATAKVLAGEGASLVVVGRDLGRAQEAARACGAERVLALSADVRDGASVSQMMQESVAFLGQLDGVAVLTGVIGHEPIDIADERWVEVFEDVMLGTVRVVREALPHLQARGGSIVTTSAYSIRSPEIVRLPYTTQKGAVAIFTKGIAKAHGKDGIRANCVCPGAIETESLHALRGRVAKERGLPFEEALERVMMDDWGLDIALQRPGQPQEVAELIAFLLSQRAGYLTGSLINIDGGTNF